MHPNFVGLYALDVARQRSIEAERRARLLRGAGPMPPTLPRRVLERLAAWLHSAIPSGDRLTARGSA